MHGSVGSATTPRRRTSAPTPRSSSCPSSAGAAGSTEPQRNEVGANQVEVNANVRTSRAVALMVEQRSPNPRDGGSNPSCPAASRKPRPDNQTIMGPNKFVHLTFALGGLLAAFVLSRATDWAWSYFAKPNDLVVNGFAILIAGAAAVVDLPQRKGLRAGRRHHPRTGEGYLAHPKGNVGSDHRRHCDGGDRGPHLEQLRCTLVILYKLVPPLIESRAPSCR